MRSCEEIEGQTFQVVALEKDSLAQPRLKLAWHCLLMQAAEGNEDLKRLDGPFHLLMLWGLQQPFPSQSRFSQLSCYFQMSLSTAFDSEVAFDVSNGISPDERYVRLAVGRDSIDAAPVSGLWKGNAQEAVKVMLQVQQ